MFSSLLVPRFFERQGNMHVVKQLLQASIASWDHGKLWDRITFVGNSGYLRTRVCHGWGNKNYDHDEKCEMIVLLLNARWNCARWDRKYNFETMLKLTDDFEDIGTQLKRFWKQVRQSSIIFNQINNECIQNFFWRWLKFVHTGDFFFILV